MTTMTTRIEDACEDFGRLLAEQAWEALEPESPAPGDWTRGTVQPEFNACLDAHINIDDEQDDVRRAEVERIVDHAAERVWEDLREAALILAAEAAARARAAAGEEDDDRAVARLVIEAVRETGIPGSRRRGPAELPDRVLLAHVFSDPSARCVLAAEAEMATDQGLD